MPQKRIRKAKKRNFLKSKFLVAIVVAFAIISLSELGITNINAFKYFSEYEFNDNKMYPRDIVENFAEEVAYAQTGLASYYADKFHGRKTANGERFNMNDYSAAHRTLPFGTILRVTNKTNGKATFVRINDRGPYSHHRIIDLSKKASFEIENKGVRKVKLEGFKFNQDELQNLPDEAYFGYSLYGELVCVNDESINILDSTIVFGHAVRMYQSKLVGSKEENAYLFVKAKDSYLGETTYYLGTLKEEYLMMKPQDLAESF